MFASIKTETSYKSFSLTILDASFVFHTKFHMKKDGFVYMQHLETVIRQKIPGITSLINKGIDEMEAELDRLGRPIAVDAGVSSFSDSIITTICYNKCVTN